MVDIVRAVRYFEEFATISQDCNSSFITLVPKAKDPITLSDYRPISLLGYVYKIVAKILANHLKVVLGSVVDEVQTAYVNGRNILDGPLMMNEMYS